MIKRHAHHPAAFLRLKPLDQRTVNYVQIKLVPSPQNEMTVTPDLGGWKIDPHFWQGYTPIGDFSIDNQKNRSQ